MIKVMNHFHFPSLSFHSAGFTFLPKGILPFEAIYDDINLQENRQNPNEQPP